VFREQSTAELKIRLLRRFARKLAAYSLAILTLLMVVSAPPAALADCNTVPGKGSDLDSGFVILYDLNFDAAHAAFAMWRATHPEDPLGPVADASAYLFQELDRLGVLQTELFLDDRRFGRREKLTADPRLRRLFDEELARADDLADKALAKDAESADGLLAMTLVYGLRADYAALIENKNGKSLSYIKYGRRSAAKLLAIDATCYDAYLALGVENYLLGIKPGPVRWILTAGGANTNREEGRLAVRLLSVAGLPRQSPVLLDIR
jgi:predicted small secreted protein